MKDDPRSAPDRVARTSADPACNRVEELKALFPEAVSEGKIDFDRLRKALGEHVEDREERYAFTWAGKQASIRLPQAPTRATLIPQRDESVRFDDTGHLFIEGENLEALKVLYRAYAGRVKMIYIDPPYNTGEDLVYADDFSSPLETYLEQTRQRDTEGNLLRSNPETSGRYHAAWLSMMYPRLFLARQLLKEDGVLFASIDDAEVAHLRLLLNEVFGEENFLACFVWKRRSGAMNTVDNVSTDHEYVLCYSRDTTALTGRVRTFERYSNPDNDPRGPWVADNLSAAKAGGDTYYPIEDPETGYAYWPPKGRYWPYNPQKMQRKIDEGRILFPGTPDGSPLLKRFKREARSLFRPVSTWIAKPGGSDGNGARGVAQMEASINTEGTREIKALFGDKVFSYPKPVSLIKALVEQGTSGQDDIVLDFFAGSCTTAQAVLEINRKDGGTRKFIMVQLPERPNEKSVAGKTDYETIADLGRERIHRVIERMQKGASARRESESGQLSLMEDTGYETPAQKERPGGLGFRALKLVGSHFRTREGVPANEEPEASAEQDALMGDSLKPGWEPVHVIYEVALKEGLSPVLDVRKVEAAGETTVWKATDAEKGQWMYVCLDDYLQLESLEPLDLQRHDVFVCRAVALSDMAAAKLALRCMLKTI